MDEQAEFLRAFLHELERQNAIGFESQWEDLTQQMCYTGRLGNLSVSNVMSRREYHARGLREAPPIHMIDHIAMDLVNALFKVIIPDYPTLIRTLRTKLATDYEDKDVLHCLSVLTDRMKEIGALEDG